MGQRIWRRLRGDAWVIAVSGLGVGFALGWLVTAKLSLETAGVAGTWVGAIATIATILWAIHVFRAETETRVRDRLESEQALALGVRYRLLGGGGYGRDGEKVMESVHVEISNDTAEPVSWHGTSVDGVRLLRAWDSFAPIAGGESKRITIDTDPFFAPDEEFSGHELRSKSSTIFYRIGGIDWRRTEDSQPEKC